MIIQSTTDAIDQFKITEYLGVVSGADLYTIGGLIGGGFLKQGNLFKASLGAALSQLENQANKLIRFVGGLEIICKEIVNEE